MKYISTYNITYNKKCFQDEIILFPGDAFHMLLRCVDFGAFFACLLSLNFCKSNTSSLFWWKFLLEKLIA